MSYALVQGQHTMAFDTRRNAAYAAALKQVITPESVVLDLGAGLGMHGLMAAQLGAKRVYLVEPEDIITVTEAVVKANGYSDRIQCLQGKIEQVALPEPVDMIISVFTGNFLLQEDLLPSLFYARDKYLKPGGALIPSAAVMEAAPVCVPDLYAKEIEVWSQMPENLDYQAARDYANQSIYFYHKELNKARYLAAPGKLMALDFYQATSTHCQADVTFSVTESGMCHGFAGWFQMQLGDTWLSTAPHEPPLHWSAAFLPIDPPVEVCSGDEIIFKLQRPPLGDWTWQVETAQTRQQHSTFFSAPVTLQTIKRLSPEYQPHLNAKGKAAMYVLQHSDGGLSVKELGDRLFAQYPELFPEPQKAMRFAQNLVCQFS